MVTFFDAGKHCAVVMIGDFQVPLTADAADELAFIPDGMKAGMIRDTLETASGVVLSLKLGGHTGSKEEKLKVLLDGFKAGLTLLGLNVEAEPSLQIVSD